MTELTTQTMVLFNSVPRGQWVSSDGDVYAVKLLTNCAATQPDIYPVTVVYQCLTTQELRSVPVAVFLRLATPVETQCAYLDVMSVLAELKNQYGIK